MAATRLPVKDILAAIDMNAKDVWKELSSDERKQISFWILNRWVSSVQGNRETQELAVLKTNEYYNKNYINLNSTNNPELFWQLLCISGNYNKIKFHKWIGFIKKGGNLNKTINVLEKIYPNMKLDEVELLANVSTKKEVKQLAEEHGFDNVKL